MKKLALFLGVMLMLTACSVEEPAVEDGSLKIVTTTPPLYSLTSHLVEDVGAEVVNLVPAGTSVHGFQLSPALAAELEDADMIVINGLGLEEFLDDVLDNTDAVVVDSSEGIKTLDFEIMELGEEEHDDHEHEEEGHDDHEHEEHEEEEEEHHDHEHDDHDENEGHEDHNDHEDHEGHNHGSEDPHIWMDPDNAKLQARTIASALIEMDGENKEIYENSASDLNDMLAALDAEIQEGVKGIEVKPFIVFHDAYAYFEDAYGLEAAAALEPFPGKEPSPQYLKDLIDLIEDNNVKVIFTEPQFSPKLAETLSEDYGIKLVELDPLGEDTRSGYFDLMRGNLEALREAFGSSV